MDTANFSSRFGTTTDGDDRKDSSRPMLDELREAGENAKRMAAENWDSIRESAGGYLETGREKAREMGHAVQEKVRREPTKALAIATVAGFALGLLWMRR